jgi:hypothetical protein
VTHGDPVTTLIPSGGPTAIYVTCPDNKTIVNAGWNATGPYDSIAPLASWPFGQSQWLFQFINRGASSQNVNTYAICLG